MHVSLYVSNMAATVNFYNTFFGQPAEKVKKNYAKYVLDTPSLIISFVENPGKVQPQFGHLGFQVETLAQMEEKLAEMKKFKMSVREERGTACCYAVQDKFWMADPDGHQWEVYYFHEDAEFNDPHYSDENASACCMPTPEEKPKVALSELGNSSSCTPGSGCC